MRVGFVLAMFHQRPDSLHGGGGHRVEKFGEVGAAVGAANLHAHLLAPAAAHLNTNHLFVIRRDARAHLKGAVFGCGLNVFYRETVVDSYA